MNSQPQENLQGIKIYSFLDEENNQGLNSNVDARNKVEGETAGV